MGLGITEFLIFVLAFIPLSLAVLWLIWFSAHYRKATVIVTCVLLLCFFGWFRFGVHQKRYTNDEGSLVVDSYYNNGQIYKRQIRGESWYYGGPMAGTGGGKPHGHWEMLRGEQLTDDFYWYGELITEGEWHLRNK